MRNIIDKKIGKWLIYTVGLFYSLFYGAAMLVRVLNIIFIDPTMFFDSTLLYASMIIPIIVGITALKCINKPARAKLLMIMGSIDAVNALILNIIIRNIISGSFTLASLSHFIPSAVYLTGAYLNPRRWASNDK